jgi:polar amino acid transport system substrate-binding protein
MARIVMKFGGTSVANLERIYNVARHVKREVDAGHEVAVVVSAMSGKTNELVDWVQNMPKVAGAASPFYDAREYDAIVASLNITEDRKNVVAFTKPYYRSPSVFVVRKGFDAKDVSPKALTGKPVGVQTATNHSAFLEDKYHRSIVRLYNTVVDAYRDLSAGRVDYVLYDKLAVYDWLKTPEGQCCEIAPTELADEAYFGSGVGIALRKGDDALVKRFNDALDGIVKDGTYAKINAKYFPFPVF